MLSNKLRNFFLGSSSFSFDALKTTTYADDYIVRGNTFQVSRSVEIAKETTVKIVADFSGVTAGTGIFLLPLILTSSATSCHVKTYAVTSYTGGSPIPCINLNGLSSTTCETVIKTGVTSSDTPGDDLREYEIGGSGTPFATRGGSAASSAFIMVPVGAILILEAENYDTVNSTFFNVNMTWYEI